MRAAIFLILVSSLLIFGCVRVPEKAMVEKPTVSEPSLSQEIGTLDDADSGINELDQLDEDLDGITI